MPEESLADQETWQGERRTLIVSIAFDEDKLEAIAAVRDRDEPQRAWVLSAREALRVAELLRDAAQTALAVSSAAELMKDDGEDPQTIAAYMKERLHRAAKRQRALYER